MPCSMNPAVLWSLPAALALVGFAPEALCDELRAGVAVHVRLQASSRDGLCRTALTQGREHVTLTLVCATGQIVEVQANPTAPYRAGANGLAYRFSVPAPQPQQTGEVPSTLSWRWLDL